MDSYFFRYFVVPFSVGALFLFVALIIKFVKWFVMIGGEDRRRFLRSIPSMASLRSIWEIFRDCLLHLKIWRINPVLGYMHTVFSLGWFTLILVGWIEGLVIFKGENVPLYVDIFFSYYEHPVFEQGFNFSFVKDLLLLIILSGVALALFKRIRSRMMGMRRTTRHMLGDRVALSALWMIFVARLLAESITSGVVLLENGVGCGSFLTHTLGKMLYNILPNSVLLGIELPAWWIYSSCLGLFFVSLPFSRYMHIFTEVPLIILRNSGIRSKGDQSSGYDKFQIEACSRCGICIDPCQLQRDGGYNDVQSVYFLRDLRYGFLKSETARNCLMCGRCEVVCPVGIDLNTLRQSARRRFVNSVQASDSYTYLSGVDCSLGDGKVGYFAGCMTLLSPRILKSMDDIFKAVDEQVWYADRNGGVCCGRPLKLSGDVEAARRIMEYNKSLFNSHKITTLVTSCPICLKVFREDYVLEGIRVLHHSEYIAELIASGRLNLGSSNSKFTYHDPCELGRGCGIYDAPRDVIAAVGELLESADNRQNALCCGGSLANSELTYQSQQSIASAMTAQLEATGASTIVTACPLCKKSISKESRLEVVDLCEIVASNIIRTEKMS